MEQHERRRRADALVAFLDRACVTGDQHLVAQGMGVPEPTMSRGRVKQKKIYECSAGMKL
ncbi:hypothetical protein HS041_08760 [Planomonospora sp. ID67723]|uniref:hypothetical protein n=1 Tax=Planomonospora sp. ID67723 TaxID=2738134 RepID=UPI0018C3B9FB|nr:hypothetical protein [Planomonospora sp. ID67723]MBG0827854.1 hypothetical protein [Planomonospora sp. ID67723]